MDVHGHPSQAMMLSIDAALLVRSFLLEAMSNMRTRMARCPFIVVSIGTIGCSFHDVLADIMKRGS